MSHIIICSITLSFLDYDNLWKALSGALSHNIHKEVDWLLERVLNDRTIDLDNDYKVRSSTMR